MSILNAITRAYDVTLERDWDTIYWALDLHGTVLRSNYSNSEYEFINDQVVEALQFISNLPESRIIIWSSIHDRDWSDIRRLFVRNGIRIHYCNSNPEVKSTETGNFRQKFYFSIVVDDKAGFDPASWTEVAECVRKQHARLPSTPDPAIRFDLLKCPRCEGQARQLTIYGKSVLRCNTIKCGAVVAGDTPEEVDAKWNARSATATIDDCRHCGGAVEPFTINLTGVESHGFHCKNCGVATGGKTPEIARQVHERGFNV